MPISIRVSSRMQSVQNGVFGVKAFGVLTTVIFPWPFVYERF